MASLVASPSANKPLKIENEKYRIRVFKLDADVISRTSLGVYYQSTGQEPRDVSDQKDDISEDLWIG